MVQMYTCFIHGITNGAIEAMELVVVENLGLSCSAHVASCEGGCFSVNSQLAELAQFNFSHFLLLWGSNDDASIAFLLCHVGGFAG